MQKRCAAAKQADVAVLFVGINQTTEREGINRDALNLPPVQLNLVRSVMEANPKTVVVLLNGGPVSLAPAYAGGGQNAEGHALYDRTGHVLGGRRGRQRNCRCAVRRLQPSGRMPYTVYASDRDLPPFDQYDITKGYTYMYFPGKPEYVFGQGLSYTNFDYSNLSISSAQIASDGTVQVKVDVKNTGEPRRRRGCAALHPRQRHE